MPDPWHADGSPEDQTSGQAHDRASFGATINPSSSRENSPRVVSAARELTLQVTRMIAAQSIANARFPLNPLPKAVSQPFNNLGHMPLCDYELLLQYVWSAVWEIQGYLEKTLLKRVGARLALLLGFPIAAQFLLAEESSIAAAITTLFVSWGISRWTCPKTQEEIASIRARWIQNLSTSSSEGLLLVPLAQFPGADTSVSWGSGDITKNPLVVIRSDGRQFPGFGELLNDATFVCPPRGFAAALSEDAGQRLEMAAIAAIRVRLGARKELDWCIGSITTVYEDALEGSSPLLGPDHRPILELPEPVDEQAPDGHDLRRYSVVQVLFRSQLTALYFMIHAIPSAGNAAIELVATAIGAPHCDLRYLRRRLRRHAIETAEMTPFVATQNDSTGTLRWKEIAARISGGADAFRYGSRLPIGPIKDLTPWAIKEDRIPERMSKDIERLATMAPRWPGWYFEPTNWREVSSAAFPEGTHRRADVLALARGLYLLVSRAIVDTMDEHGYEVSEYRDKQGNYTIKADNIDRLILGDRVTVNELRPERPHQTSQGPKPGTAKPKEAKRESKD